MSEQQDQPEAPDLGQVSDDLSRSLRRCSGMVRDYRSRLIAANSNDFSFMLSLEADNDGERHQEGDGERTG